MNAERLYHTEVFVPRAFVFDYGILELTYSQHALRAANTDRYGAIALPKHLDTDKARLIEFAAEGRTITKLVYRMKHCARYDLVVVVIPGRNLVKTVWLNAHTDLHTSLDKSKYVRAA